VTISRRSTTGGLLPSAGYSVTFDNRFGTRAITDLNFWHSELTVKGAFATSENTRLLYRYVQGANLGSDSLKVPPSLRFFAGGDQNLRGFSYKSQSDRVNGKLTGSRYLSAGSLEFNFPIPFENSRGAVFLDTALCTNNYSNNDLLYGPGLGYRYLSPYGILKIDLAYGIDNKRDNREFKLHLSFGPEF
ncbi:MAG: BamA/TamA family outer membrane protein, partial [Succinivibrio sp.]